MPYYICSKKMIAIFKLVNLQFTLKQSKQKTGIPNFTDIATIMLKPPISKKAFWDISFEELDF